MGISLINNEINIWKFGFYQAGMAQYHAMQDMVFLFQWFTILSQQQNLDVTAASMNFGNFCRVGRINTSRLGSWSGSRSKSMSFANIYLRYIVLMKNRCLHIGSSRRRKWYVAFWCLSSWAIFLTWSKSFFICTQWVSKKTPAHPFSCCASVFSLALNDLE